MTKNDFTEKVEGLINIKEISIHTISVIEILDIFLLDLYSTHPFC